MNFESLKVLVTGSSGTIGNCLCENLLELGAEVVGVDKKENKWNEKVAKRTIIADLRNKDELKSIPEDIDFVVHFAANARVFNLVKEPDLALDNFIMLYNVLEFMRGNKIKNILFSSSREVYGNSGSIIHTEDESYVKHCESSYTATKIAGEALIHSYNQCYDMDYIITRFSNVFGRYDYSDRVVPLFILKALANEDIRVFGRDKILDFTFIEDTVSGVIKSISNFESAKNEVYNIATQKGASIERVAVEIIKLTKSKSKLYFDDNRTGEVCRFIADISKAKAVLDYKPKFNLIQAIEKSIEWYAPRIDEYRAELGLEEN